MQFPVEISPPSAQFPAIAWTADFFLPIENVIVEAKGDWVNSPKFKAEKALFKLQFQLASFDYHVICVSSSAFQIDFIDVKHYSEVTF